MPNITTNHAITYTHKQKFLGFRNPDFLKAFFLRNVHSAYHLQAFFFIFSSRIHFSNNFTFPCSSLNFLSTPFTYISILSNFSSTLPNFSKTISNFGIMLPAMLKVFIISSVDWLPLNLTFYLISASYLTVKRTLLQTTLKLYSSL